ncbi:hypothetical protein AB0C76_32085, partial [Kitasatospora sp. NPDC048722]|uniref:hypothetical protein n=1 Tax=Kitasatospora sp. NPDC048722 TaxID=3155639 RepID=UPI0033FFFB0A
LEADDCLQPDPLARGPLGVGQAAALRVSHKSGLPKPSGACQANGPDITRSSSVEVQEIENSSTSNIRTVNLQLR